MPTLAGLSNSHSLGENYSSLETSLKKTEGKEWKSSERIEKWSGRGESWGMGQRPHFGNVLPPPDQRTLLLLLLLVSWHLRHLSSFKPWRPTIARVARCIRTTRGCSIKSGPLVDTVQLAWKQQTSPFVTTDSPTTITCFFIKHYISVLLLVFGQWRDSEMRRRCVVVRPVFNTVLALSFSIPHEAASKRD